MNLLSWNYRGLGAPHAVHELAKLVSNHNPQVLFLIETNRRSFEIEWLRVTCLDKCFTVDYIGRSGSLALLCMNEAHLEVLSYFRFHIDVKVTDVNRVTPW